MCRLRSQVREQETTTIKPPPPDTSSHVTLALSRIQSIQHLLRQVKLQQQNRPSTTTNNKLLHNTKAPTPARAQITTSSKTTTHQLTIHLRNEQKQQHKPKAIDNKPSERSDSLILHCNTHPSQNTNLPQTPPFLTKEHSIQSKR